MINLKTFTLLILLIIPSLNLLPIDLLKNINTDVNEFSPTISPDGSFMLFNTTRNGDKYQDIYISYFTQGIWSKPEKFHILNSPFDDETPFISPDGKIILFSSNRDGSIERKVNSNTTLVSYDIYWSHLVNERWTLPEPVPGNINTPAHERAPSINHRNDRIFFSRWAMGKIDNAAIYFSALDQNQFTQTYLLPPEINSGNKEVAFIPDPDGNGYYFSSMREGGKGGWDIYFISFRDGQFGRPTNLEDPINTKGNEAFFSIYKGKIYYCSDFKEGKKDYDIITRYLPGGKYLNFSVTDNENNPLTAEAEIQKNKNNHDKETSTAQTNIEGKFSVIIDDNTKDVNVFIEKPGYLPYYKKIEEGDLLSPEFKIILEPLKNADTFTIEAIYFDYNKFDIKPESFVFLDRLSSFLNKSPEINLVITGHTDLHGDDEFNKLLSENRAKSVKSYLVQKGVNQDRLKTAGLGKSRPVINEISEHADRLNRRTEFKVFR